MKPVRAAALLVLGAVIVLPACGKRGDPQPPFSRIPRPVTAFEVAQRGDTLELRYQAPQATAGGLALEGLEIEVLRADRTGDIADVGLRERRRAEPGEAIVQQLPLPPVGTRLRVAARAVAGGRQSPLAGPVALVIKEPPPAPADVAVSETEGVVLVRWTAPAGWTPPTPVPPPAPGASPSPSPVATPPPVAPAPAAGARGGRGGGAAGRGGARPAAPFLPGFNVYRRVGDGDWARLTPTPLLFTEYKDAEAPAGSLCYVVRFAAAAQAESAPSAPACLARAATPETP